MSCLWVLLLLATAAVASGATDVVTMTTGERLVGEIKKLEKDVLTLETTFSDSDFKIEWEKIASLESDREFLIETFDGKRLSGTLKVDPAQKGNVLVGTVSVPLPQLAAMVPYERSFWSRFDAGFDFGYSMTQANSAKQLTVGGTLM